MSFYIQYIRCQTFLRPHLLRNKSISKYPRNHVCWFIFVLVLLSIPCTVPPYSRPSLCILLRRSSPTPLQNNEPTQPFKSTQKIIIKKFDVLNKNIYDIKRFDIFSFKGLYGKSLVFIFIQGVKISEIHNTEHTRSVYRTKLWYNWILYSRQRWVSDSSSCNNFVKMLKINRNFNILMKKF